MDIRKKRRETRHRKFKELLVTRFDDKNTLLAKQIGIADNLVSRYANGTKGIGEDMKKKIEDSCGLPKDWLDDLFEDEFEDAPPLPPFKMIPIVGTVQGGNDGYLLEYEAEAGHGDGSINYPAKDSNTYAVRVRGDSMRPRIKSGEFIIIEPNQNFMAGDDVVVCLKDGRKMVKEFLYERDGEVTLNSINNGHGSITVLSKDIEKIHYVAAIIPRGSFYKRE